MEAVIYLTFVPWALYCMSMSKSAINDFNQNKINFYWIKKNIFKIFHFDNLILFAIFVYFSYSYPDASQIWLVEVLLFSVINIYLYMNRFYDKNRFVGKIGKDAISIILIILLIMLGPIFYYVSTKNYVFTYYLMFGYGFFNYLIVFIATLINKVILKIIAK